MHGMVGPRPALRVGSSAMASRGEATSGGRRLKILSVGNRGDAGPVVVTELSRSHPDHELNGFDSGLFGADPRWVS